MRFEKITIGTTKVAWPVIAIALVGMPIVGVVGLRSLKRPPASALAQDITEAVGFKPSPEATASANALALVSQFNAEALRGFGPSPMTNRTPAPAPKPVVVDPPKIPTVKTPVVTPTQPAQPPQLQVTSIMAASNGSMMAVINGKPGRVGSDVGNGFRVASINAETGEVTIRNRAGTSAVFVLKKQSDE
jgi:hypothetical protein